MSQGPINFGGIGDIDMYTEETSALLRRLYESGKPFGDALPGATGTIEAGEREADTGFDTLSTNFRASYNASDEQLKQLSKNVKPLLEHMGTQGAKIVAEYIQHAADDAARMRSLE
ncbi:hypothetical protein AB0P21_37030 [Kribbella sp. NPDC056861]|uniref:hypothetical protein n=1 Tax=Kribbella sp. NPDC056861 TaxID=3154857 RepID=UPI00343965C1